MHARPRVTSLMPRLNVPRAPGNGWWRRGARRRRAAQVVALKLTGIVLTSVPPCAILWAALEQHTFLWREFTWPERGRMVAPRHLIRGQVFLVSAEDAP